MRKRIRLVAGLSALMLCVAMTASAQEGPFEDVPEDHLFVDDVRWMQDNGITFGCNPPANTLYCPEENTTRGQEAAFFHRFAESRSVDAGWLEGHPVDDFVLLEDLNNSIDEWLDENLPDAVGDRITEVVEQYIEDNADQFEGPPGPQGPAGPPGSVALDTVEETTNITLLDFSVTATCPGDTIPIGGGYETSGITLGLNIFGQYPDGQDWVIEGAVVSVGGSMTVHATCMDPNA